MVWPAAPDRGIHGNTARRRCFAFTVPLNGFPLEALRARTGRLCAELSAAVALKSLSRGHHDTGLPSDARP